MKANSWPHCVVVVALAGVGCASVEPSPELVTARRAYAEASRPGMYPAPTPMLEAQRTLDAAEYEHTYSPQSVRERHLAYIATRDAQIAMAQGEEATARAQADASANQYTSMLEDQNSEQRMALEPTPDQRDIALAPLAAHAPTFTANWQESRLRSGFGIATVLGGGVSGFTETSVRRLTADVQGLWNLRVTVGSHDTFALDFDYVGTAGSISVPTHPSSETLVGTNFNAALRYSLWPAFMMTPYVFGGTGYQHYNVSGMNTPAISGIRDGDTFAVFPLGVGLAYRASGLVIDVRGTLRLATDSNLIASTTAPGGFASMQTWEASAGAGYEF